MFQFHCKSHRTNIRCLLIYNAQSEAKLRHKKKLQDQNGSNLNLISVTERIKLSYPEQLSDFSVFPISITNRYLTSFFMSRSMAVLT